MNLPINIVEIMKQIPHRYPFLLIDRVVDYEPGKSVTAIKNVTINEPFFEGHFGDYPVMPGVLIMESLAQASGILTVIGGGANNEKELFLFAGIDKARFRRQVIPGDQLVLKVTLIKSLRGLTKYHGAAYVNNEEVADGELLIAKKEVR